MNSLKYWQEFFIVLTNFKSLQTYWRISLKASSSFLSFLEHSRNPTSLAYLLISTSTGHISTWPLVKYWDSTSMPFPFTRALHSPTVWSNPAGKFAIASYLTSPFTHPELKGTGSQDKSFANSILPEYFLTSSLSAHCCNPARGLWSSYGAPFFTYSIDCLNSKMLIDQPWSHFAFQSTFKVILWPLSYVFLVGYNLL